MKFPLKESTEAKWNSQIHRVGPTFIGKVAIGGGVISLLPTLFNFQDSHPQVLYLGTRVAQHLLRFRQQFLVSVTARQTLDHVLCTLLHLQRATLLNNTTL